MSKYFNKSVINSSLWKNVFQIYALFLVVTLRRIFRYWMLCKNFKKIFSMIPCKMFNLTTWGFFLMWSFCSKTRFYIFCVAHLIFTLIPGKLSVTHAFWGINRKLPPAEILSDVTFKYCKNNTKQFAVHSGDVISCCLFLRSRWKGLFSCSSLHSCYDFRQFISILKRLKKRKIL